MKIYFTVDDTKDIRAYAKEAVKSQVKTVVREELRSIVQDTIKEETERLFHRLGRIVDAKAEDRVRNLIGNSIVREVVEKVLAPSLAVLARNIEKSYLCQDAEKKEPEESK